MLGEEFVGLYLHGSLALGDFDSETSDIDFATVTQHHLEPETIAKLEVMHKKLLEDHAETASILEGAYIPLNMFRHHDTHAPTVPQVHGDAFYLAQLEPHWVLNRAILQESGVRLAGPNPNSLIDPISLEARQNAVRDFLLDWWQPMLTDSTRLKDAEYRIYTVQTMARALCTLKTGELRSKPGAVHWALEHLPGEWHETVRATQCLNSALTLRQTTAFLEFATQFGGAA